MFYMKPVLTEIGQNLYEIGFYYGNSGNGFDTWLAVAQRSMSDAIKLVHTLNGGSNEGLEEVAKQISKGSAEVGEAAEQLGKLRAQIRENVSVNVYMRR